MEFIDFIQLAVLTVLAIEMFDLNKRVRDLEMYMES